MRYSTQRGPRVEKYNTQHGQGRAYSPSLGSPRGASSSLTKGLVIFVMCHYDNKNSHFEGLKNTFNRGN